MSPWGEHPRPACLHACSCRGLWPHLTTSCRMPQRLSPVKGGPPRTGGGLPSSVSQPEKLKIKSKPSSGFGHHLAQPLAGSTAPTFHDFRTFPKPRQLQGEEGERRKTAGKVKARQTGSEGLDRTPRLAGASQSGLSTLWANSCRWPSWELSGCRELEGVYSGFSSTPSFYRKGNWGTEEGGKGPVSSPASRSRDRLTGGRPLTASLRVELAGGGGLHQPARLSWGSRKERCLQKASQGHLFPSPAPWPPTPGSSSPWKCPAGGRPDPGEQRYRAPGRL